MTDTETVALTPNELAARDATNARFKTRLASADQRNGYEVGYYEALVATTTDKALLNEARAQAFEEAARFVERRAEERFAEYGIREGDTNATYYEGSRGETLEELDKEDEAIATAIRALAKLSQP